MACTSNSDVTGFPASVPGVGSTNRITYWDTPTTLNFTTWSFISGNIISQVNGQQISAPGGGGLGSEGFGLNCSASSFDTTVGYAAVGVGTEGVTIGNSATNSGPDAVVIGFGAGNNSMDSVAIGANSLVQAPHCVAIGRYAQASSDDSIIIGWGASNDASAYSSIVIGKGAIATDAIQQVVIGDQAHSASGATVCIGESASIDFSSTSGIAIGNSASCNAADSSIAIGVSAQAAAEAQVVLGANAVATDTAVHAVAIGNGTLNKGNGTITIGKSSSTGSGCDEAVAIGLGANLTTDAGGSVGIGSAASSASSNSIAIGPTAVVYTGSSGAIVLGHNSFVGNSSGDTIAIGHVTQVGTPSAGSGCISVTVVGSNSTVVDNVQYASLFGNGNTTSNRNTRIIMVGTGNVCGHDDIVVIGDNCTTFASGMCWIGSSNSTGIATFYLGRTVQDTNTVSINVQPTPGVGTNVAGGDFTIRGGNGTGTGGSGKIIFQTAPAAASSSAANTLATVGQVTKVGQWFFGGSTTPTAWVHLAAGTTAASKAPLKFTSGSLQTTAEAGAVEFLTDKWYGTITTGAARKEIALNDSALTSGTVPVATTNGRLQDGIVLTKVPVIQSTNRSTAQTAAKTLTAFTVGAADASFLVSANVNVTTSTAHSFTVTCTYTDETNTSRVLTLTFSNLAATFLTTITNVLGAGPYEGVPMHIRCKAATTITIASAGTFTTVTYNLEQFIQQLN